MVATTKPIKTNIKDPVNLFHSIILYRLKRTLAYRIKPQTKYNTCNRDVPVIHPVPGKCRIFHYSILPGPGKIMGPSNKKNFFLNFLLFITVSKKSYGTI